MFGRNPVRKQDLSTPDSLNIVSIFHTIQGEGPYAGDPAVFIRLAGCNLRCYFCDTDFETDAHFETPEAILSRVQSLAFTGLVVLTGGEPMLQNITKLCRLLHDAGFHTQVETAGTVWVEGLPDYVDIVCSPKTANVHPKIAEHCTTWKYLVSAGNVSMRDGLPMFSTQDATKVTALYRADHGRVYLQPMDEGSPERNAANVAEAVKQCMKHGHRLSIQVHKIIGVE